MFLPRWRSGSRTGVLNRRKTRGRTRSCVQWFQKQRRPAASSDCWSRDGCWRLQACQASYPTVAAVLWALPCALPPWPSPATVAVAAAAAARRAAVLLYLPPPAQGQQRACRAPQQLTASSASPCPLYLVVSLAESPPTPCPWLDHWLETCRNFLPATWAHLLLSLTRGPMAKILWTKKFWNDTLVLHRWIPVSSGHILVVFLDFTVFVWFGQSLSSVCVMFCGSLCIPVAHLAPCTRKKTKTSTSSSDKDRVVIKRFCTKGSHRTLLQIFKRTQFEVITEGCFRFLFDRWLLLSINPKITKDAVPLQEKWYIVYSRKCRIGDRKHEVMVPFWIVFYHLIVLGRCLSPQWEKFRKRKQVVKHQPQSFVRSNQRITSFQIENAALWMNMQGWFFNIELEEEKNCLYLKVAARPVSAPNPRH